MYDGKYKVKYKLSTVKQTLVVEHGNTPWSMQCLMRKHVCWYAWFCTVGIFALLCFTKHTIITFYRINVWVNTRIIYINFSYTQWDFSQMYTKCIFSKKINF